MEIKNGKQEVKVKPHDYQPKKAELEEKIHVPTTPEKLAKETVNELNDQLSGFSFPITKYRFN